MFYPGCHTVAANRDSVDGSGTADPRYYLTGFQESGGTLSPVSAAISLISYPILPKLDI